MGVTSGGRRSVNFGEQLEVFQAQAALEGLKFNRWVVRACGEALAYEVAAAAEDARVEGRGAGSLPGSASAPALRPSAEVASSLLARVPERAFRPDPRPVSSKKKR